MKIVFLLLVLLAGGIGVWLYSQHQRAAADSATQSVAAAAPSAEMLLAQDSLLPPDPHRPQAASLQALPRDSPRAPMPTADKAADLTTLSGRTYKQARVFRVEPDGINYIFAGGIVKVPFDDLPSAVGRQYGYDPARARTFTAEDDAMQAQAYASAQAQTAATQRETQAEARAQERAEAQAKAKRYTLAGNVAGKVPGGLIVECEHIPVISSHMASMGGGGGVGGGDQSEVFGRFLVRGFASEAAVANDDWIKVQVIEDGQYQNGGETVRAYKVIQ